MTTTRIGIALIVAWLSQTTLVPLVAGTGAPVDLVLVVVVFAALARGPVVGLWTGTLGGLVQDALSAGIIGVSGLAKSIVVVLVGIAGSQFIVATVWHRVLIIMAASIVHTLCFAGVYALGGSAVPAAGIRFVVIQAATNAAVGITAEGFVRVAPGVFARIRRTRSPLARRHWTMS